MKSLLLFCAIFTMQSIYCAQANEEEMKVTCQVNKRALTKTLTATQGDKWLKFVITYRFDHKGNFLGNTMVSSSPSELTAEQLRNLYNGIWSIYDMMLVGKYPVLSEFSF